MESQTIKNYCDVCKYGRVNYAAPPPHCEDCEKGNSFDMSLLALSAVLNAECWAVKQRDIYEARVIGAETDGCGKIGGHTYLHVRFGAERCYKTVRVKALNIGRKLFFNKGAAEQMIEQNDEAEAAYENGK